MIRYIQAVAPKSAQGLVKQVYAQINQDFGRIVEPFLIHSPLPELLAGAWMACRETELVGSVLRSIKEAVAVAVSRQNQCPYCVDAHTVMLTASGEKDLAKNVCNGRLEQIADDKTRAIVKWALKCSSDASMVPFTQTEAPEIIGTIVYFHYINRMANVLLSQTPLPSNNQMLKSGLTRIAGMMFSSAIKQPKAVGDSLMFLPEVELPPDLVWAKPTSNVAGAFARFSKAVEIDGEYALPLEVRLLVQREIDKALIKEFNFNYIEQATVELYDEALQSAAKLALMTGLMPNRIDDKIINTYRKHYPEDSKLLATLAWASFSTARKIGGRIFEEIK